MRTFQEALQAGKPVLVDFFATWCGPCKMMTPILHELKEKTGDDLMIIKVDVDKQPAVAGQFQVQGVPTLILFVDGAVKWRQSGVIPATQLMQIVQPYLKAAPRH